MDEDGVVLCRVEIKDRLQHLIPDLDQLHSLFHCFFRRARHDRRRVPHKTDSLIQDQPVIRAGLGVGLSCHCEPLVRTVLIGKNTLDTEPLPPLWC